MQYVNILKFKILKEFVLNFPVCVLIFVSRALLKYGDGTGKQIVTTVKSLV